MTIEELKSRKIRCYFDLRAPSYIADSNRILWRIIREKEKTAIFKLLDPTPNDFILDAGCGAGYYLSILLEKSCKVIGIDLSSKMVEEARRQCLPAIVANIENSINIDEKYDKIMGVGVLEFCYNDTRAIMNLKNALKARGIIVLLLPKLSFAGFLYKMFHLYFGCREKTKLYNIGRIIELIW